MPRCGTVRATRVGLRLPAARATWFDEGGTRFLEVERFDRVGPRGRRGVISLGAWDNEHLGSHRTWASAAGEMERRGELSAADGARVRWLDVFGQLIANGDRHFWNVTFFWELGGAPKLAPAYDMLPMQFAPTATAVVDRPYVPAPPTSELLDVWPDAARAAATFWDRVAADRAVSIRFRDVASRCGATLAELRGRLAHLTPKKREGT